MNPDTCVTSRVDLTYLEQCLIQIDKLRNETLEKEVGLDSKNRRYCKHRLFRQNIFEEIPQPKKQHLNDLLRNALRKFGSQIYRNLLRSRQAPRTTLASTPTPIEDLSAILDDLSSLRTCSRPATTGPNSVTSDSEDQIIQPEVEIIALSSDDEEIDDEDDIIIKEEEEEQEMESANRENFCVNLDDISTPLYPAGIVDSVKTVLCDGSNIRFDDRGVVHLERRKKIKYTQLNKKRQALFLHILAKIMKLFDQNRFMTKRELYYLSLDFCRVQAKKKDSQRAIRYNAQKLDSAINEICCLFGCSRVHLRILAQAKGIVYGDLKFQIKSGQVFDAMSNKEGILLPSAQQPIVKIESNAKFILVIEKDSVLQKILSIESRMQFVKNYQVILFTARGYPDIISRAFLNFLWAKLKIPILSLTDADPHGIDIMCAYKFGCYSTAQESVYLAVPQMRWLGFLPGDIARLSLSNDKTIGLTVHDVRKIKTLKSRTYLKNHHNLLMQINIMRALGRKAELESLDKSGEYLVKTYLPNKIRYASWL